MLPTTVVARTCLLFARHLSRAARFPIPVGINSHLAAAMARYGLSRPDPIERQLCSAETLTAIQHRAFPVIRSGASAIVTSETGSGKTLGLISALFACLDVTVTRSRAAASSGPPSGPQASEASEHAQSILPDICADCRAHPANIDCFQRAGVLGWHALCHRHTVGPRLTMMSRS